MLKNYVIVYKYRWKYQSAIFYSSHKLSIKVEHNLNLFLSLGFCSLCWMELSLWNLAVYFEAGSMFQQIAYPSTYGTGKSQTPKSYNLKLVLWHSQRQEHMIEARKNVGITEDELWKDTESGETWLWEEIYIIDMSMEEGHELSKCYAHNLRQWRQHMLSPYSPKVQYVSW